MDINRYHGAEWRRLITETVPSLVVLSALPLVFAPYEDEPSRLLNERIARCVQRLRTRIPFTSYKLAVNNHSRMAQVLTSHFDHIRYLHLIIAWDAHPEHVPNFSEFNSLTHVLVDRVPHPAYYRSSNSTIISAVTACLKAPNLERVLVRYPVRLKPDSDIKQGLAQLAIEKDDTRIWLDLDTYSVISDANSVHLEDSMCGLEPFLRGQAVLSG
ncbi:hypothetical protein BKA62DRAFT_716128 [Auriculariales sp. MPI-PUGE-AT-0066]|nr:hypothetical protein BKA62DRAFT_716128 [Auriculariales sp. MPI-PUGE-AT-0066]